MTKVFLAAAVSGLALLASTPANAALTISYSTNGGPITQLATDAVTPGSAGFTGNAGGFFFNVGATGTPITNVFDLLTQSINIQNAAGSAGTLNVFITDTGLPSLNGSLMSAFTTNTQQNVTARVTSFYSPTNAVNGGTVLQTAQFNNIGTFTGTNALNVTGPFSTTIRYDLTFGAGFGNFNGTANLSAVPEPATWGMMIAGFGLVGGVMRRRKTSVAFA